MTPLGRLRTLLPSSLSNVAATPRAALALARATNPSSSCPDPHSCLQRCRCFAQVNDIDLFHRNLWFNSSVPRALSPDAKGGGGDHKPLDERTLQLGKTIRTLHDRLPTLLKEPLPSEILSPSITLHLFPSTHPHLPTVSGRLGYIAALWTAPVAWGRMPLVGNVQLVILSERMVRNGGRMASQENKDERLVVKWKTCGKTTHRDGTGGIYRGMGLSATRDPVDKIKGFIAGGRDVDKGPTDPEEFCGLFIFEFDEKGRIAKHTIEHTDEGGHYDRMTRVVSVTDWLFGQINGRKRDNPALALCEERPDCGSIRLVDRRARF